MKLELKNIKHTAWASEETHCYQASLYVDGKPVAIVSNDGRGGADRDYRHPKFKKESEASGVQPYAFGYRAKMAEVHEYFASLPKTNPCNIFPEGMEQTLEFWCCDQVNDWLSARELKNKMKKQVLFQKQGEAGVFGTEYDRRSAVLGNGVTDGDWVTDPRAAQYGRRILNDMPFADALAIWKETAL